MLVHLYPAFSLLRFQLTCPYFTEVINKLRAEIHGCKLLMEICRYLDSSHSSTVHTIGMLNHP